MDPRVVAISGPLQGQVFRLAEGSVSIGRIPSNRMAIPDAAVSRQHCVIELAGGHAKITDLESHNGTFVNGIPVSKRTLQHGDQVRVGQSELVFLTGDDTPSLAPRVSYGDGDVTELLKTVRLSTAPIWSSTPSEVGRMARDLNALVKISGTINSIRDPDALQRKLLECIFEVIPADRGAILVLDDPDEEPASTCTYARDESESPPIAIRRELMQRALWEQAVVVTAEPASAQTAENVMNTTPMRPQAAPITVPIS